MFNLDTYIVNLTCKYPLIKSIWLIGSRANNTYRGNSDWDLIIFAGQEILEKLKEDINLNMSEVDLLVVYDGENFRSPWSRGDEKNNYKSGCLKGWQWYFIDTFKAKYKSDIGLRNARQSDAEFTEYTPEEKEFEAKRLWPN